MANIDGMTEAEMKQKNSKNDSVQKTLHKLIMYLHKAANIFRIFVKPMPRLVCIQSLMKPVNTDTIMLAIRGTEE